MSGCVGVILVATATGIYSAWYVLLFPGIHYTMPTHSRDKENRALGRRSASPPSRKTARPTFVQRSAHLHDSINTSFDAQISDANLWAPFPPPPPPPPFIVTLQGAATGWRAVTPELEEDGDEEDQLFPDPDDTFPGQNSAPVLPPSVQRPATPPPPYEAGSQRPQQTLAAQAPPQVQPSTFFSFVHVQ